jgi:uncharacterized protein YdeI (YjbR/CyaY-like superfamily)
MIPRFFKTVAAFEAWLAKHHATRTELWVGLYKKHAAHRGMTYPDAVDAALCWGWIDGLLRSIDEDRVMQRYTPRKAKSTWSLINVGKVERLIAAGRMRKPGMAAFEAREAARTGIYSFETPIKALSPAETAAFKKAARGWRWFNDQAASYRRAAIHWVVTPKRPETRVRRFQQLLDHAKAGKKLRQFTPMDQRKG